MCDRRAGGQAGRWRSTGRSTGLSWTKLDWTGLVLFRPTRQCRSEAQTRRRVSSPPVPTHQDSGSVHPAATPTADRRPFVNSRRLGSALLRRDRRGRRAGCLASEPSRRLGDRQLTARQLSEPPRRHRRQPAAALFSPRGRRWLDYFSGGGPESATPDT